MSLTHAVPTRLTALFLGLATTLLLLTVTARKGSAEKAVDECMNHISSVCRMVETCSPKGFEPNGNCNWIYTVSRYYWKY